MSTCNIDLLVLSVFSQVSAMAAVSTSQLPAANDMYGQFTLPSETTSHQITVYAWGIGVRLRKRI